MPETIEGYRCLTAMQTAGSGSARWCIAARGLERYFLKEFLKPVYPVNPSTPLGKRQTERCRAFENRKQRLYSAASCVIGDVLVPVVDFFRVEGHYYAVSEAVPEGFLTADKTENFSQSQKQKMLYDLAVCLQRLHAQDIVHADLKPEHVLLNAQAGGWRVRLIDLDSGFLAYEPPGKEQDIEGDPAYLAPEAFLHMVGQKAHLTPAMDVFAFGVMIHQIWTGHLPLFDTAKYHYLYEAVLAGGVIGLALPKEWKNTVYKMLDADPMKRPSDAEVAAMFAVETVLKRKPRFHNSLSEMMKL